MRNFILAFLSAELIMASKINDCEIGLAGLAREQRERDESAAQRPKAFDLAGITEGQTYLQVRVFEARGLQPLGWNTSNNSFVALNFAGAAAKTRVAETVNPVWNEAFELYSAFHRLTPAAPSSPAPRRCWSTCATSRRAPASSWRTPACSSARSATATRTASGSSCSTRTARARTAGCWWSSSSRDRR